MPVENEQVLSARGVRLKYPGGILALAGVDFAVRRGEFVALLGANGSGKTTLLKVLVGLLHADAGEVFLVGAAIRKLSQAQIARSVGLVLQNPDDQLFAPTVAEDVAFGPRNLGLAAGEVERRVDEALASVGAAHLRSRAVHRLSFGEKKRVSIAGALAMGSAVLVLDEPTAGLDPAGEVELIRLLQEMHTQRGQTIVLASHAIDLVPVCAGRAVVLAGGAVCADGPLAEVLADRALLGRARLRLPYVADLFEELQRQGLCPGELPLTVATATGLLRAKLATPGTGSQRPVTRMPSRAQVAFCEGCCCSRVDRGHLAVPRQALKAVWKAEKLNRTVQLTFSGCLGPCDRANVAVVLTPDGQEWYGGLETPAHFDDIIAWARGCQAAGRIMPRPARLRDQQFTRFTLPRSSAPPVRPVPIAVDPARLVCRES